jgi:hypothetical protein
MNEQEFLNWLQTLLAEGNLTNEQVADLRRQRELFDAERSIIETQFLGHAVGYIADERWVEDSVPDLLDRAVSAFDGSCQLYFEPIGYTAFGEG